MKCLLKNLLFSANLKFCSSSSSYSGPVSGVVSLFSACTTVGRLRNQGVGWKTSTSWLNLTRFVVFLASKMLSSEDSGAPLSSFTPNFLLTLLSHPSEEELSFLSGVTLSPTTSANGLARFPASRLQCSSLCVVCLGFRRGMA